MNKLTLLALALFGAAILPACTTVHETPAPTSTTTTETHSVRSAPMGTSSTTTTQSY